MEADPLLALAARLVPAQLRLEAERKAREGEQLRFNVVDDGPGISVELQGKLGTPFTTGSDDGTGLGLMLARSVARQHGGELHIENNPSVGARAWLELPLGQERR